MRPDNTLRPGLPELPPKMRRLPIDDRGFPVPFFVATIDGEPDHRIADPSAMRACITKKVCWLCGGPLGAFKAFTLGPMCGVNRISSEPPSHLECAQYAARACPFLARPHAHRRAAGMIDDRQAPAGLMIERNPGVTLVWITKSHRAFNNKVNGNAGVLFDIGLAERMECYAEGRAATIDEVLASVESGMPALLATVKSEDDIAELQRCRQEFVDLLHAQMESGTTP